MTAVVKPKAGYFLARLSCALFFLAAPARAGEVALSIGDISNPAFQAEAIAARLSGPGFSRLEVRIGRLSLLGKTWRNARLTCPDVRLDRSTVRCSRGTLEAEGGRWPLSFRYDGTAKALGLDLDFPAGERWRIETRWGGLGWTAKLDVVKGQMARLAPWLPEKFPSPSAGTASGTFTASGQQNIASLAANFSIDNLDFSDVSGLHAGEKVGGTIQVQASRRGSGWQWRGAVDWQRGEVFWQPVYFAKGGHRFAAQGSLDQGAIQIERGSLRLAEVGEAEVGGVWDIAARRLRDFDLSGKGIELAGLYRVLLKPFLEKTAFGRLQSQGKADLAWRYRKDATTDFDLALREVSVEDEDRRFALHGVTADIPWASGGERQGEVHLKGGYFYRIPVGEVHIPLVMQGWRFTVPPVAVPVLDGRLSLDGLQASRADGIWQWQFSGGLAPISMDRLSDALKLPRMHGTLSGVIPRVSYAGQRLKVDGALLIKIFDGTVVIKDLELLDTLGRAPRLHADLDMRNLDLDLLTRTFSFGSMQGRVDVRVEDLELSNWRPVKMDAVVRSSPGDYPRKISQRAVQNISALGGAGAAAAIQRSFLRFFREFSYDRIGLSCMLRNDVCYMDGVEAAPHGYVIVKGGGIPAITVIGYNHSVSWDELLERLKRITQGDAKPIVQ
jgi:hypothetical protein